MKGKHLDRYLVIVNDVLVNHLFDLNNTHNLLMNVWHVIFFLVKTCKNFWISQIYLSLNLAIFRNSKGYSNNSNNS